MDNQLKLNRVIYNNKELAIIIREGYCSEGVQFLTDSSYSQQLAYMHHDTGKNIDAHVHNHEVRSVKYTQEVLILRKGKLRVDFYDDNTDYLKSTILYGGDIILLADGGHGFKVLEEVEMIEIKQGPYLGENDKVRFPGIDDNKIIMDYEENSN